MVIRKLCIVNFIKIFCREMTNFVTVHSKYSKITQSTSVNFASRIRRLRVFLLSWYSRFFMEAAVSKMRASNSFGVSTLDCNHSELETCSYELCYYNGRYCPGYITDLSFIITLCITNTTLTMSTCFSAKHILAFLRCTVYCEMLSC
jgi:hypothetical protein